MSKHPDWRPSEAKSKNERLAVRSGETSAIEAYLHQLQRYPQLKHAEVVDLFQQYEAGATKRIEGETTVIDLTPEAKKVRTKLVECNLRLVVSIAKQYKGHNIPIEDLIQEGNIGLMKSIERFDWKKGFRFSTYSTWWIKQAIGQHVLKRKRLIRLPAHAATVQRKMLQAAETYRDQQGSEPTSEELMALIGASETVVKATIHSGRGVLSLQQPTGSGGNAGGVDTNTLENKIEDERPGCDPFENVAEKQLFEIVRSVLNKLSAKEAAILRLRFGLVDESITAEAYPITEDEIKAVMSGKGLT